MLSIYLTEGDVPGVLDIVKEFREKKIKPEEDPFIDVIRVNLNVFFYSVTCTTKTQISGPALRSYRLLSYFFLPFLPWSFTQNF
jgi:hypothetical protein